MSNAVRHAYIHVPFCRHRCGYCNFTLVAGRDDLVESYLEALELELSGQLHGQVSVDTIFLGGGTPSHLSPSHTRQLLDIIAKWFELAPCGELASGIRSSGEFSCEANPLDCSEEKLQLLASYGVNRISLGGQSFSDQKLRFLERDHRGADLGRSIDRCLDRFPNVSLDLIFAGPGESLTEWQADYKRAMDSGVQHLSTYGLTIEPGAAFYGRQLRGRLTEQPDEMQYLMFESSIEALTAVGWEHYEVSNFCLGKDYECSHNNAYWEGGYWYGFGPGAASFLPIEQQTMHSEITTPSGKTVEMLQAEYQLGHATQYAVVARRQVNHRSTSAYIRRLHLGRSPVQEVDDVSLLQLARERLVFGLRRLSGVSLEVIASQTGVELDALQPEKINRFIEQGYLRTCADGKVQLTKGGLMISDCLWPDLLG